VTAVIVNYNGARHLPTCIASLRTQTWRVKKIIVVDNGSTDQSAAICQGLNVEFLATGRNIGLGAAYNRGVAASQTEFAVLLNNDVELDDDCIGELLQPLAADARLFAADPMQLSWDRTQIIHYCCTLRASEHWKDLAGNPFAVWPMLKRVYVRETRGSRRIPFACGGAMMVRVSHFREVGGFDEAFFLDWEDVDLGWRANLLGYPSVFVTKAVLRHRWGASTEVAAKWSWARLRMAISQNYNMMRFAIKCLDARNAIMFPLVRLAIAPLYCFRGGPGYALAIMLAAGKLAVTLPSVLMERWKVQRRRTCSSAELLASFRDDVAEYKMIWPSAAETVGSL
jgi:GT2 family glycosyltransferase